MLTPEEIRSIRSIITTIQEANSATDYDVLQILLANLEDLGCAAEELMDLVEERTRNFNIQIATSLPVSDITSLNREEAVDLLMQDWDNSDVDARTWFEERLTDWHDE